MYRTYLAGLATGATGFGLMGAGLSSMILHPDPFVGGALMGLGACLLVLAIWIGHEIYHGRFERVEGWDPRLRDMGPSEPHGTHYYVDPRNGCDDQDGLSPTTALATMERAHDLVDLAVAGSQTTFQISDMTGWPDKPRTIPAE